MHPRSPRARLARRGAIPLALAALIAPAISGAPATGAEQDRHGLKGDYYLSSGPGLGDFVEYRSTRVDANLDFDSLEGPLLDATGYNDEVSVRWTGQLLPGFTEDYRFHVTGDNGFRIWVDGRLVIDHWVDDWDRPQTSAPIRLTAGQRVEFKVEYFENWGGSNLHVDWSSASQAREPIPADAFFLPEGFVPEVPVVPAVSDVTAVLDALAGEQAIARSAERDLRALLAAAESADDYDTRVEHLQAAREWLDTAAGSKLGADARSRLTVPLDALLTPRTPAQRLSADITALSRDGSIAGSTARDLLELSGAGKLAEARAAVAGAKAGKVSPAAKGALLPQLDAMIERGHPLDLGTAEAGNPIVSGWYADPDIELYDDRYWVYPTTSRGYDEQTFMDAFSSTDLVHWTKHSNILDIADVPWARRALWAPAPVERNGKYYLYFAANDIQNNNQLGGIGVAVADRPEGPYKDALGKPLIGQFHNGAQPIDQDVFIDDDGQAYMYYGGHSHANVVKLNPDMISLGTFADGTTFKEITPTNYVEGSFMFKRGGKYYLMWSEGGWTGPNYAVSYAIADSPTGPFNRLGRVLQQDAAVARGSGHNSVINVPGTDIWYIFYHRRPLTESEGNSRALSYDRMYFNPDGTIRPVTMLVQDDFEDRNSVGWRTYGGLWSAADGTYAAPATAGTMALQETNFGNLEYEADVRLGAGGSEAGLVFRVGNRPGGASGFSGYYAALTPSGVSISSWRGGTRTPIASAPLTVAGDRSHRVRVEAVGSSIKVYVDGSAAPVLSAVDTSHTVGANGLRAGGAGAWFDNVKIEHP
ncbi:family 43 glycosylhydrolase [Motilibacter aurantiacus]|uniref:family 43 glycosylhydrolase n=1 Tax=Motilibacter aurantiacus TaxID=2714955 RepID=UPI0018C89E56|nr:family 43 glycosylhydrolase [Motilibacter aurantiacus]NHC44426.1 family 43 glycosylhydrolase [Motilibacter aurantiacus]